MKQLTLLIISLIIYSVSFAQTPQSFQYQAVVRDAGGTVLVNQPVSFQISIIYGTLPGTVEYVETHSAITNAFGIVTISVGNGTPVTNLFSNINWSTSPHHIKVEVDLGSGYVDMGITQLLSVPYALHSNTAVTITGEINSSNIANGTIVAEDVDLSQIQARISGSAPNGEYIQQINSDGSIVTNVDANTTYTAGSGIDVTGTVISNTAPDQNVTLTQGGATTISGSYPNFTISSTDNNTIYSGGTGINVAGTTITNTAPDQTVSLTQGGATTITGAYPNFSISSTDNNSGTPGGTTKAIQYNNSGVFAGDSASLAWDYTNKRLGVGISNPVGRVVIKGSTTALATEPLFEVKNKLGQTVFVVYQDSVSVYVNDDSNPSNQGGFAVSGRSNAKAITHNYLKVTPDNTRIHTGDSLTGFGVTDINGGPTASYMQMTPKNYFIGHEAGKSITSGQYNSFIGYKSGLNNTIGDKNYFIGYKSGYSNSSGYSNIFIGDSAGFSNDTAFRNVFIGNQSGFANTGGNYNVFLGYNSGYHNLRSYNVFIGYRSGYTNTFGMYNVANGYEALFSNDVGSNNVAIGNQTLYSNTSGGENTANGYQALFLNKTGTRNVAIGLQALYSNVGGGGNVANGYGALYLNSSGNNNVAIGYGVLFANTTGSNNTAVGNNCFTTGAAFTNSTALGANSSVAASNQIVLGNNAITSFYCIGAYAATSANAANMVVLNTGQILRSTSSKRYKKDIENLKINTEDIYKLRPVSYISIMDDKPYFGLVAEEVAEVIPELAEFAIEKQVIPGSNSDKIIPDAVKYPMLSVLLLSEMQNHQKKIIELNEKNEILTKKNENQELLIKQLIQRIEKLENK